MLDPEPAERRGPVEREGHDRVVHGDGCDGQVVRLGVPHRDPDLAGRQLDPADLELVRRRGVRPDQVDDLVAAGDHERDRHREQQDGYERPEAPGNPACGRARLHQSSTLKYPIQPSSVNSDWCAWNMKVPVFEKRISITPRWPWHCITVSVYSQFSPVPVGW